MQELTSGIYQIRNLVNGKIYVGSAVDLKARWRLHKANLKSNKHHSKYLQNAWNKYKGEAFLFEILIKCPINELIALEQYYMDFYQPEYNICRTAGSVLGIKRSEETRKKMILIKTGLVHSEETKRKISFSKRGKTPNQSYRNNPNRKIRTTNKQTWKRVIQICSKTLQEIEVYESVTEASKKTNLFKSGISACAKGKLKTCGGYIWKYQ